MQDIIFEKPYEFIPPHRGKGWPWLIQRLQLTDRWLRKDHGIIEWECRDSDLLRASLDSGHGIMLTPNHCRPCDPIVMGWLARDVGCYFYAMASWHLFHQDWLTAFAIRRMGGFSVYREGIDRKAINTSIEILEQSTRPLILFPEGATTRTNDRLNALLDGVAFIARSAAKKRKRHARNGKVVIHPVALKYLFQDDLEAAVDPVLTEIEHRFTWRSQRHLAILDRVTKIGMSLLALKETEYFGRPQNQKFHDRLVNLINRLLNPLEEEWLGQPQAGSVVPRVKNLRMKIMPQMVDGELDESERSRRWRQLEDIYLAQQVSSYPPDYLEEFPSVDRLLETVERFEEDITDEVRVMGSQRVIIQVGEAIEVKPQRDRRLETDPLMELIDRRLQSMLDQLSTESRLIADAESRSTVSAS